MKKKSFLKRTQLSLQGPTTVGGETLPHVTPRRLRLSWVLDVATLQSPSGFSCTAR